MFSLGLTTPSVSSPDSSTEHPDRRVGAATDAERTILARLDYNRVKRGRSRVEVFREDGKVIPWFPHVAYHLPIGLHEGILLGDPAEPSLEWLEHLAETTGAALFKLIRAADQPVPEHPLPIRTRRWTVFRRPDRAREWLPLAATFEQTLAEFGRHTRRNIRSVRRRAASDRLAFQATTDRPLIATDIRAALARKTEPRATPVALAARLEAYIDRTGRPFRAAIRAPGGSVVSYACGYFGDPGIAYLLYQLNEPVWNARGPSLMLRAFLIEWLIGRGCRDLVFVHGCSGVLFHACRRQSLEQLWLMRRTPSAYLRAAAFGLLQPNSSIGSLARAALAAS